MTAPPVTVRAFHPDDASAAIRMLMESEPWKTLGYRASDWEGLFRSLPVTREGYVREGYVIESGGIVAGIALLRPGVLLGEYLELLVIAPGSREQGLGRRLLTHVEGVVFARAKNLFVCVSDFNHSGQRFYERLGYGTIGPIPDLLVSGRAEILMRKTVGPVRS